ncbi:MAG: coproporphyrinogen-III oxidase family protein [Candidatus Absconditabacterales bacterium]
MEISSKTITSTIAYKYESIFTLIVHKLHSVYIHIPFCNYKCDYCNFFVLSKEHPNFQDNLIEQYLSSLHQEIDMWAHISNSTQVKTIYIGGGTPATIGAQGLIDIIDHISRVRSCEYLEEISIELNPDPFEETIQLVRHISKYYASTPRIRFSRGLQTFDDEILKLAGRSYTYNNIKGYLRELQKVKQSNHCYNFDFIAFGTLHEKSINAQGGSTWNANKWGFFEDFVNSYTADSFSLYMLELFPGSKRESMGHNPSMHISPTLKQCITPDDEAIVTEHHMFEQTLIGAGYNRYEVSNFALPGKNSSHNSVYWTMQPYIGIGASASGMLPRSLIAQSDYFGDIPNDNQGARYTNTTNIMEYIQGKYIDNKKTIVLQEHDIQYESFMLSLRSYGISNIEDFTKVLVPQYKEKLDTLNEAGLIQVQGTSLKLTREGYNVANRIIGELLQ